MSEKPQRRTFSAAQKVAIVKRHLIDKVAVSDLCEEYQIQPTLFYQWQKQLFENGTAAFERKGKSKATTPQQRRIAKLEDWEKQAILSFHAEHGEEGYRRLTYMMMDADIVAASPASVYRVLKARGAFERWNRAKSRKGTGFCQPLVPHEHWHVDISHINVCEAARLYHLETTK